MLTSIITGLTGRAPFTALILISIFSTHVIVFLFLEFVFILVFLFLQYFCFCSFESWQDWLGERPFQRLLYFLCICICVRYVVVFVFVFILVFVFMLTWIMAGLTGRAPFPALILKLDPERLVIPAEHNTIVLSNIWTLLLPISIKIFIFILVTPGKHNTNRLFNIWTWIILGGSWQLAAFGQVQKCLHKFQQKFVNCDKICMF